MDTMDVHRGDIIIVRAFPEKQLERRVLDVKPPVVVLTTDEELSKAKVESRQPFCIGFRLADIVRIKE
jgi:hypothetical protein